MRGCGAGLLYKRVRIIGRIPPRTRVVLARLDSLRPHEAVIDRNVQRVLASIVASQGYNGPPVLVERSSLVILDGHHRVTALKRLGARLVPALLVSYDDPRIALSSWRGIRLSPGDVLGVAREGRVYPPKTTRHLVLFRLPRVIAPLDVLAGEVP